MNHEKIRVPVGDAKDIEKGKCSICNTLSCSVNIYYLVDTLSHKTIFKTPKMCDICAIELYATIESTIDCGDNEEK